MVDDGNPAGSSAPATLIPATGFPPPGTAVAFADGVSSMAHGTSVVKFYLFRTDPDVAGSGSSQNNIVGQIVMPVDGFVLSAVFLYKSIELLISKQLISQLRVDEIKSQVEGK
jgi:hypothetical protein